MIIGVCGKAGAGKDYLVKEALQTFGANKDGTVPENVKLTAPIKSFCAELFGWGHEHLEGSLKETIGPLGFSPRMAMQKLGTEFGRALHPDLWVNAALCKIRAKYPFVYRGEDGWASSPLSFISDVRFQNEAEAILGCGGVLIYVDGGGLPDAVGVHASESNVENLKHFADYYVDNRVRDPRNLRSELLRFKKLMPLLVNRKLPAINVWKGLSD